MKKYKRKKQAGKREKDLAGLPTERVDYEIPEGERVCPQCGETMPDIGVDVRRELKYIPARVMVVEHARHAYACKTCGKQERHEDHDGAAESTSIMKAEAPAPLIPKSIASAPLVAAIAEDKYVNSMPLYRQAQMFARDGIMINRQNMANWLIYVCEIYLRAIYGRLIALLSLETVLHADET